MCFSASKPKTPQYITNPGADADQTQANTAEQRRRAQLAGGQSSTLLTGSQGDTSAAVTGKKTLLGA
ncbi:hypothetical protein [Pseudoxanthomonas sp. X-1]|uniref:hypothetical protein n=1 Tax=Pseudoxanthomonas sp. X-1 TaxID=2571115 RepID=UPI00110A0A4E|nr:hypothetical protein [Pseudoxanthomonas sp. X-1]TMN24508.1 hypothetical protein FF950_05350 [Pseudoxanthomonas sp. X-1]UAY75226.1 hypothetical protein LAJ50_02880 [Pseudoxanthomonas sp. X-1]